MKTIKEISEHFAEVNNLLEASWGGKEDEIEYEHLLLACKQTAEYIQKWIPVSEELPLLPCFLIAKKKNDLVLGLYYNADREFMYGELDQTSQVTHWRPIELK